MSSRWDAVLRNLFLSFGREKVFRRKRGVTSSRESLDGPSALMPILVAWSCWSRRLCWKIIAHLMAVEPIVCEIFTRQGSLCNDDGLAKRMCKHDPAFLTLTANAVRSYLSTGHN
eukprot:6205673-Pleurochrysis_carterae.AAC.1